jgi:hypothetical protein
MAIMLVVTWDLLQAGNLLTYLFRSRAVVVEESQVRIVV